MAIDALEMAGANIVDYNKKSKILNSDSFLKKKTVTLPNGQDAVEYNQDKCRLMLRKIDKVTSSFLRNMHSFVLCHANISKIKEWKGKNSNYPFSGNKDNIKDKISCLFKGLTTFNANNVRELRNHLEHYEERLFHFSSTAIDKFSMFSMGNISSDVSNAQSMRCFLYEDERALEDFMGAKKIYKIRNDKYNILDMEKDIFQLKDNIIKNDPFEALGWGHEA
jgi:hypothetical protein